MKLSTNTLIILFGMMALGLLALFPISIVAAQVLQPRSPADPQATVQAMVTQTVMALTLAAPTQTPIPPSPIVIQVTTTPMPPTSTPVSYCDWAAFIKDVTIADGTLLNPDETFTKVWRLKNRGTCTWTPDYMLVFSSGAQMGGTTALRLPGYVAPGQTVDVSVTLTAPTSAGPHTGYWMLRNPSGTVFATGDKANIPFYVDIKVRPRDLPHGMVSGRLCYPSEFNPSMTLYFEQVYTGERVQFAIIENQNTYSVLLPTGIYYAFAWATGFNLEGAYTHPNGLMKTFEIRDGQTTAEINLCDWTPYSHGRGQ